jgi:uncharacterized protein (DUF58 family)
VQACWDAVEIKRKRLFTWGAALLIFIFIFTPLVLVQFLSLFFLFILAGSRFYTEYLIKNIRIKRMDPELRVFRHHWVRVELKIENHGLLPAFMLIAGDMPGKIQVFRMSKIFCTLFRHSWAMLNWEGLCSDRGVFPVGPAIIRGSDPLGLFPFSLTASETSRLFVYPVMRSIRLKNRGGIPLGNMSSANPLFEDINRYKSLRPYKAGDEKRRINWKASARTVNKGILVNEYEASASYPLMIFLNVNHNEYPERDKRVLIERCIEAAAALCLRASRERQDVGIIFFTSGYKKESPVIAPSAFTLVPILEHLAAFELDLSEKEQTDTGSVARSSAMAMLEQGKRLSYGTRYLYIGPGLGDEVYMNLNILKKHHLSLEYFIIDKKNLPLAAPGNSPLYQIKEDGHEIV